MVGSNPFGSTSFEVLHYEPTSVTGGPRAFSEGHVGGSFVIISDQFQTKPRCQQHQQTPGMLLERIYKRLRVFVVSWATKCPYVTPGAVCERATWVSPVVGLRSSDTLKRPQAPANACIRALEAFWMFISVVGTLVWCETDQKRPQTTLQHGHQTASKGLKGSHWRVVCGHF